MIPSYSFTGDSRSLEPQAIQRMAADAYEATKRIYYWLTEWREMRLEFDDGSSVIVLGKQATQPRRTNRKPFGATDVSEGDTRKVRINDGLLWASHATGLTSEPPTITTLMREMAVAGAEFTVADGDIIYCEITVAAADDAALGVEDESGDYVDIEIAQKNISWQATGGELKKGTSLPAGTASKSFRRIAEIEIEDGSMTIVPWCEEAITVPAITFTRTTDVTVTEAFDTTDIEWCDYGTVTPLTVLTPAA
jgi:hypothetical protein